MSLGGGLREYVLDLLRPVWEKVHRQVQLTRIKWWKKSKGKVPFPKVLSLDSCSIDEIEMLVARSYDVSGGSSMEFRSVMR
jgi:hypothetical protein